MLAFDPAMSHTHGETADFVSLQQPSMTVATVPSKVADWRFALLWGLTIVVGAVSSLVLAIGGPVLTGVLQWRLLRRYIRGLEGLSWVPFTTMGTFVGPIIGALAGLAAWGRVLALKHDLGLPLAGKAGGEYLPMHDTGSYLVAAALAGLVTATILGVCQWIVLYPYVHRVWRWAAWNALAGAVGGAVIAPLSALLPPMYYSDWASVTGPLCLVLVGMLVYGIVAGVGLTRLVNNSLRSPSSDTQ